jgi:hypothetical protein
MVLINLFNSCLGFVYINAILGTCVRLTAATSIQTVTNTCISESGAYGTVTFPMCVTVLHRLPLIAIMLERSKIFRCNYLIVYQLCLLGLDMLYEQSQWVLAFSVLCRQHGRR